jgi:cysteinyl-tRNA synthetase
MSKSLKNFITIRQALVTHTARQIRFCFLLHKYNATMDYGDSTMNQAITIEKIFVEFFHNIKAVLRRISTSNIQYIDKKGSIVCYYILLYF